MVWCQLVNKSIPRKFEFIEPGQILIRKLLQKVHKHCYRWPQTTEVRELWVKLEYEQVKNRVIVHQKKKLNCRVLDDSGCCVWCVVCVCVCASVCVVLEDPYSVFLLLTNHTLPFVWITCLGANVLFILHLIFWVGNRDGHWIRLGLQDKEVRW